MKFVNESVCLNGRGKVCNYLNRLLHEFIVLASAIIVTILFCEVIIILLLDELPPQNYSLFHYAVKVGKINGFERVSFVDVKRRSNCITCCTWNHLISVILPV
jgi:hypothetical protein